MAGDSKRILFYAGDETSVDIMVPTDLHQPNAVTG
jgi:hypothetical protein